MAHGATLVTGPLANSCPERAMANANRIAPDQLARSGRQPEIIGVDSRRALVDGDRRIEIHAIQGSVHAQGFMLVYLPQHKLLIEADAYTPGAPNSPPPAVVNANNLNLVQNVERLGLQVERILPLHGRVVPYSELLAAVGRKSQRPCGAAPAEGGGAHSASPSSPPHRPCPRASRTSTTTPATPAS